MPHIPRAQVVSRANENEDGKFWSIRTEAASGPAFKVGDHCGTHRRTQLELERPPRHGANGMVNVLVLVEPTTSSGRGEPILVRSSLGKHHERRSVR